jgi:hypothetical protein
VNARRRRLAVASIRVDFALSRRSGPARRPGLVPSIHTTPLLETRHSAPDESPTPLLIALNGAYRRTDRDKHPQPAEAGRGASAFAFQRKADAPDRRVDVGGASVAGS